MNEENQNGPISITITMVGPTRVGKTSLLAAMYNELNPEIRRMGCTFTADGPTTAALDRRLQELKAAANFSSIKVQEDEGIKGGFQKEEFIFNLKVDNKPEAVMRFVDMPGAWYTGGDNHEEADTILSESQVSFLAVDATALMEKPDTNEGIGEYHERVNAPFQIQGAYERALAGFSAGHIVVLTLIRAETYVLAGRTAELYNRAKKAYRMLADSLKAHQNGEVYQIPVFITHVETVGNMVLHRIGEKDGHIRTEFRKNPNTQYSPKHCARPLRFALGVTLYSSLGKAYGDVVEKDTWWREIAEEWFGVPTSLGKAKQKLTQIQAVFEKLTEQISDEDYHQIEV